MSETAKTRRGTTSKEEDEHMFGKDGSQVLAEVRKARAALIDENGMLAVEQPKHSTEQSDKEGKGAHHHSKGKHHKEKGEKEREKKKKKTKSKEELFIIAPDPSSFAKVTNEVDEKKYKDLLSPLVVLPATGAGQAQIQSMNPKTNKKALVKGVSYFEYVSPCFQEAAERINLISEEESGIWSAGMSMSALRIMSRKTLEDPTSEDRKVCMNGADCTNTDPSHFLLYR